MTLRLKGSESESIDGVNMLKPSASYLCMGRGEREEKDKVLWVLSGKYGVILRLKGVKASVSNSYTTYYLLSVCRMK